MLARLPDEVAQRFRSDPAAHERLCAAARLDRHSMPLVVAASAWPAQDPFIALRMRWLFPAGFVFDPTFMTFRALDFEALTGLLDATDTEGDLPLDWLERSDLGTGRGFTGLAAVERTVAVQGRNHAGGEGSGPFELELDPETIWRDLERDLAPAVRQGRFARLLLKEQETPDRLRRGPHGEPVLEVLDGLTWRPFDFGPPGPEAALD